MSGSSQWPEQPRSWGPPPGRVSDCTALVLDGVWPYELAQPRDETAQIAHYLDRDLREIVERTNEQLASLVQLNLAPAEHRAAEERFIRVAKAMAVLRAESTVRQLGGRSILGTPGMPTLTSPPVQPGGPERENEIITEVSAEVIDTTTVARAREGEPGHAQMPARHYRAEDPAVTLDGRGRGIVVDQGSDPLGRHRGPNTAPSGSVGGDRSGARAFEPSPTDYVAPERLAHNGVGDQHGSRPPGHGQGSVNGHPLSTRMPAQPMALEPAVSLQQMVGSLARQQPGVQWLVAERGDGSVVAVCDVLSGWIPAGIVLPVGVTVLTPEKRSGPMEDWVGPVTRSARYGPGNRIERRSRVAVAGDEAFSVVDVDDELGVRIGEATNRPGLPRITHTVARAADGGGGVLAAELDVLNVHMETALQMVLGEYPGVNADEVVSCMLMGAAAAIAERRVRLAAYHFGWYEAIAGRR